MAYLTWEEQITNDYSDTNIEALYNQGFVFTRLGKGVMHKTRSARVELDAFSLTSENRRILKKTEPLSFSVHPLPYSDYSWEIGKMGKDFYDARGADFSANKIKELITSSESNFNRLYVFKENETVVGYCISLETEHAIHYSYPFYKSESKDTGLGMMLKAMTAAQEARKTYFYIGSLQRPSDTYKLQFNGIEWFDGTKWNKDIDPVKELLQTEA